MTKPRRSSRRAYDRVSNGGEGAATGNVYSRRRRGLAARGRRRLGRGGRGNDDDEAGRRMLNEPLAPNNGEEEEEEEEVDEDDEDYEDEEEFDEELGGDNSGGDPDDEEMEETGGIKGTGTNSKGKVPVSLEEDPLRGAITPAQDGSIKPKSSPTAISVVVLDGATSRFHVEVEPTWTVGQFKEAGSKVYKVQPDAQRLIHMGKLLSDAALLKDVGIDADDKIVHLFPKPNVVYGGSTDGEDATRAGNTTGTVASRSAGTDTSDGAHVPQIVVDAEEAERRSQVVILNSVEVFEAQSRVKLLSFLLLIVSSMELLTLFTLFFGSTSTSSNDDDGLVPPGDPTDSSTASTDDDYNTRTWRRSDYADTLIALFGFYVALLGIRATTENTVAIVRRYFVCLVVLAVAWNIYDYMLAVRERRERDDTDFDDGEEGDGMDIYIAAFLGILLPFLVWCICLLRAWQFHQLITQAERESEERRQGIESAAAAASSSDQNAETVDTGAGAVAMVTTGGLTSENGATTSAPAVPCRRSPAASSGAPADEDDLELQVEARALT